MRHFKPINYDRWGRGWDESGLWDVVAYHDHCADGLAAAATVARYCASQKLTMPKFVPVSYGKGMPPEILAGGERLLFVDFCPEREEIRSICKLWADWFVVDHHKSREWIVQEFPEHCVFDLEKCGAMLAEEWLYFHPHNAPPILRYVQDRDLWQWRLPSSREVSAALKDWEPDVETWHHNIYKEPIPIDDLVSTGRIILRQIERYAKARAQKCYPGAIGGMPVLLCNATQHMSEVAEQILEANPLGVAAVFWQDGPEDVRFSFRSRPGGKWTALAVASALGGGGHEHAAGAKTTL